MGMTYVDAVLDTLSIVEFHVSSEYDLDFEAVIRSVSKSPTYAFMPEPGRLTVITDHDGVRDFYAAARDEFTPIASRIMTHVAGDWYEFEENVPTRCVLEDDRMVTLNTAMIFPNAGDGIQGEFLWQRLEEELPELHVPPELGALGPLPTVRLRNARIHELYLDRLRSGKVDEIMSSLAEDCLWAVRSYVQEGEAGPMIKAEGRSEVRDVLEAWTQTFEVQNLAVLTRVATEWYVFAEELYTVEIKTGPLTGELRRFRTAVIYPIGGSGAIQGALGYGTDLVEADSPVPDFGRISWVSEGVEDDLCLPETAS